MAIIRVDLSQKGGVGKSTSSFNLAAALAEKNPNNAVLLIDLDPQGHATEGIGLQDIWVRNDIPTMYEAMMDLRSIDPSELIMEVPHEKFFAIPSNYKMMVLDKVLTMERGKDTRLYDVLEIIKPAFTHIIIDSPSYFGNLTDNLIRAIGIPVSGKGNLLLERESNGALTQESRDMLMSGLVVPIQAEKTSIRAFELLLNQIELVETELKIKTNILSMAPNLVKKPMTNLAKNILGSFQTILPEKMTDIIIPQSVVFQEAYDIGNTIFSYTPKDSKKMKDVQEMRRLYLQLAQALQERGEEYVAKYQ